MALGTFVGPQRGGRGVQVPKRPPTLTSVNKVLQPLFTTGDCPEQINTRVSAPLGNGPGAPGLTSQADWKRSNFEVTTPWDMLWDPTKVLSPCMCPKVCWDLESLGKKPETSPRHLLIQ